MCICSAHCVSSFDWPNNPGVYLKKNEYKFQSASQWLGKYFAVFDCWTFLCADQSKPNGCQHLIPIDDRGTFCSFVCLCCLCCSATCKSYCIRYSFVHHTLYGIYVHRTFYLNMIFSANVNFDFIEIKYLLFKLCSVWEFHNLFLC